MMLIFLLLLTLPASTSCLSKRALREKVLKDLTYPPESITLKSILRDANSLDEHTASTSYFEGPSLAYVTTWNDHGFTLAKRTAKKLTHISPVWFEVIASGGPEICFVHGVEQINRGWMDAVRAENSELKIVPRVIFQQWELETALELMKNEQIQTKCARSITNFIKNNGFDGAVIEVYVQLLGYREVGLNTGLLVKFMEKIARMMQKSNLEVIFTIFPPISASGRPHGFVNPDEYRRIVNAANFTHVMTYDFPASEPTGVAPFDWVMDSMDYLAVEGCDLTKVLVGINWYGLEHTSTSQHIFNKRYLEVLSSGNAHLDWDDNIHEHVVQYGASTIYYPSLTSMEMRILLSAHYESGIAIWDYGQGLDYFCQLF